MRRKVEREEILEKGLEIMMLHGIEGTGVQDIAKATNMLKGSFYNYFPSKEAYVKELIQTYSAKTFDFTKAILEDKSLSPVNRFKKLLENYWTMVTARNGYEGGCFLGNCSQEIGNTSPVLSEAVDAAFRLSVKLYADCIREAQEAGEVSKDQLPETLAEFILSGWQGVLVRTKSAKSDVPYTSFMELVFSKVLV